MHAVCSHFSRRNAFLYYTDFIEHRLSLGDFLIGQKFLHFFLNIGRYHTCALKPCRFRHHYKVSRFHVCYLLRTVFWTSSYSCRNYNRLFYGRCYLSMSAYYFYIQFFRDLSGLPHHLIKLFLCRALGQHYREHYSNRFNTV